MLQMEAVSALHFGQVHMPLPIPTRGAFKPQPRHTRHRHIFDELEDPLLRRELDQNPVAAETAEVTIVRLPSMPTWSTR